MTPYEHAARPARFSATQRTVDGVRVVMLHGEIDHDVKDAFTRALSAGDDTRRQRTVADLSQVTFMDSSGINVLLAVFQQASGSGGWVRIAGARQPVLRMLELVGVDAVIPCHPTVEEALAD